MADGPSPAGTGLPTGVSIPLAGFTLNAEILPPTCCSEPLLATYTNDDVAALGGAADGGGVAPGPADGADVPPGALDDGDVAPGAADDDAGGAFDIAPVPPHPMIARAKETKIELAANVNRRCMEILPEMTCVSPA